MLIFTAEHQLAVQAKPVYVYLTDYTNYWQHEVQKETKKLKCK